MPDIQNQRPDPFTSITTEGKLDIPGIKPIARMGYYDYTCIQDVFEMRIPNASGVEKDGLEGKAP